MDLNDLQKTSLAGNTGKHGWLKYLPGHERWNINTICILALEIEGGIDVSVRGTTTAGLRRLERAAKRGSGGWEYESRRSHFRRKQRFPHPSFEFPSLLLSCLVQMAAESNRIKYIPEDRPIDYHRQWYLPTGSCSANTTIVSFAKVSSFRLLFRPHRQPPNNLLVFTGSFYRQGFTLAAEQRVYRKFIKAPCNWVEKENRR